MYFITYNINTQSEKTFPPPFNRKKNKLAFEIGKKNNKEIDIFFQKLHCFI